MNLEREAKLRRRSVILASLSFVFLYLLELIALIVTHGQPTELLISLSSITAFGGCLFVFALHYLFHRSHKRLLQTLVDRISKRDVHIDSEVAEKVFHVDIYHYLRQCYLFIPRFHAQENEVLITPVEGVLDYIKNHQSHKDLNTLDEKKNEILKNSREFKFSVVDLVTDIILYVLPFALIALQPFQSFYILMICVAVFRLFSIFFYVSLYKNIDFKNDASLKKLNVFINTNLKEDNEPMSTRIDFKSLLNEEAQNVFMIVSENRKSEVKQALRYLVTNDPNYNEWQIFSLESLRDLTPDDQVPNNLIVIFPSELDYSHAELLDYINKAENVIVVDISPSLALSNSVVYYIDHDQRVKKVKATENIDRLSGDKGLILKNLHEKSNLKEFLEHLETKLKGTDDLVLVFKDVSQDKNTNDIDTKTTFLYPSKKHAIYIREGIDQSEENLSEDDIYCKLNKNNGSGPLDKAKSFIANCSYHRILKQENKKAL